MEKHKIFIAMTLLEIVLLATLLTMGHATARNQEQDQVSRKRQLVSQLQLTDLSIWTEARYTRHPSQTDFFSPFQDFPSSLEHFPAGSIVMPQQMDVSPKKRESSMKESSQ